jgi:hypothetical protein
MDNPHDLAARRASLLADGYDPADYRGANEEERVEAAEAARDACCHDRDESHQGDE